MNKKYLTWEDFDRDINLIAKWIKKQNIKVLFAIPNGGLVMGVVLANKLSLPLYFDWEKIKFDTYTKNQLCIVDDISDKGDTLAEMEHSLECYTVTWCVKGGTKFQPNYYIQEFLDDDWVVFPWEPKTKECKRDETFK